MPIFKWLTGQGKQQPSDAPPLNSAHGSHRIDRNQVLRSHGGISPINPSNFSSIRSNPLLTQPQYFTPDQADQITIAARERRKGAIATKRAYKALAADEESDLLVHLSHRAYEGVSAAVELKKKQADAQLARQLHGQRASYARLSYSLDLAGQQAQLRIAAAQQQMDEQFQQMAQKLQGAKS